jgi:hypothetical protein
MATRALIGYLDDSRKITTTYNHYDGYPEYLGKILKEHYNSEEKAKFIANEGYISSIDEDGTIDKKFNNPADTMVLDDEAYSAGMQIGEQMKSMDAEFGYVYFNDEWNTVENGSLASIASQLEEPLGESGMYIVDENKEENIMEQGYEAKWAKFLTEAKDVDFNVLKKYLEQETNEGDSVVDAYLESVKRDFNAGGMRKSDYDDYEMDDYVEDFINYNADKRDA